MMIEWLPHKHGALGGCGLGGGVNIPDRSKDENDIPLK